MFGFWDWVGGRYSMDSAIGLATMIAIGTRRLPRAARGLPCRRAFSDYAVRAQPARRMGLLAVWYRGFFGAETVAVLPYDQYLKRFPAYLQLIERKRVTLDGEVDYDTRRSTAEPGTNGQALVLPSAPPGDGRDPVRLHGFSASLNPLGDHHDILTANLIAEALAFGKPTAAEVVARARPPRSCDRAFRQPPDVDDPSEQLTPRVLGSLVALYEHSVFTQGVIWNVDSFDQWGVELGKVLATRILPELSSDSELAHDSSTNALIERYRSRRA